MTLLVFVFLVAGQDSVLHESPADALAWHLLIPESATMSRAWDIPRNPGHGAASLDPGKAQKILRGFRLFMNTSQESPRFSGGSMTCNNCHPNGGQRERAMPLIGVPAVFPEHNRRAGRSFSLEERIVGCLLRSVNATGTRQPGVVTRHENELTGATLTSESDEVQALAAYIRWLSTGDAIPKTMPWRGRNSLPPSALIPIEHLNPTRGEQMYAEHCSSCHASDGQGVSIGDKRPGPLWGPNSWNDGAGAARTYTLAGMIRYWMPYLHPGTLSDEEAQHIAAYITSKPRPRFPFKDKDYTKEKIPVDAVYYPQRYARNPLAHH